MAGNIKGITIEIGGETTKLEKALKNVNSTGKDLNKQLKEIDRNLKFNPNNTELLEQKQRALASSIENTKEKLKTLKLAQEQANEALAKGKIGQDEYDALTREIIKAEGHLKSFENKQKDINSSLKKMGESATEFGNKMKNAGEKMRGVSVAVAGAGAVSYKMAADFQDSVGAAETIFNNASKSMLDWANNMPAYYGIAKGEALEYANTMGAMLQNIGGKSEEEASKMSQKLVGLAGDLSAMFGGSTEQAVQALTGALKGNNAMLDNYGMGVNEATIKTKALEMGLIKGKESMTLAQKQTATLALIMEQSAKAQGQASREAEGASGSMKAFSASVKNLSTSVGEILLPVITPLIQGLVSMLQTFQKLPTPVQKIIVVLTILAGTLPIILITIGQMTIAIGYIINLFSSFSIGAGIATTATTIWSTVAGVATTVTGALAGVLAFLTSPIGLIIVAIGAVIAILVVVVNKFGGFKKVSQEVAKMATQAWTNFKTSVVNTFNSIITKFSSFVSFAKTKMTAFANTVGDGVKKAVTLAKNKATEFFITGNLLIAKLVLGVANKVFEIGAKLVNGIKNALSKAKSMASQFISVGWDIVSGVVRGIADKISEVANKAREMVRSAIFGARKEADSHSPSRVMIKEGHNFGDGLIVGIQQKEKQAEHASSTLVRKAINKSVKELNKGKNDISKTIENIAEKIQKTQEKYNANMSKRIDNYKKREKELTDGYNKELKDRTNSLANWIDLFDEVPERQEKTAEQVLSNLKSQNLMFEEWKKSLQSLFNKGIDINLYNELKEKGVQGVDYLTTLNSMTKEQLNEFVTEWKKKRSLAEEEAKIDLKPSFYKMNEDLQKARLETVKEIDKLSVDYAKSLNKLELEMQKQLTNKKVVIDTKYIHDFVTKIRTARKEITSPFEIKTGNIVADVVKLGKETSKKWIGSLNDLKKKSKVHFKIMENEGKNHGINFMDSLIGGIKSKESEFFGIVSNLKNAMSDIKPNGEGVNWYAKGGIFNSPSVIGVGEAGTEAVIPLDRLDDLVNKKNDDSLSDSKLDIMIDLLSKLLNKNTSVNIDGREILNLTDKGLANRRRLAERGL